MEKQIEIPMPSQPKNVTKYCPCLKGERIIVVMRPSLSPEWYIGKCNYCGKQHFQKTV